MGLGEIGDFGLGKAFLDTAADIKTQTTKEKIDTFVFTKFRSCVLLGTHQENIKTI